MSSCFFCRESLNFTNKSSVFISGVTKKSGHRCKNNLETLNMWDEQCALSLCRLLQIPRGDPSASALLDIQYGKECCSSCHQLIRNIDFTLGTIIKLHKQLLVMRSSIYRKLSSNALGNDEKNVDSQNHKFVLLLEKIQEKKAGWTEVDFLSSENSIKQAQGEMEDFDSFQVKIKEEPVDFNEDLLFNPIEDADLYTSQQPDFKVKSSFELEYPVDQSNSLLEEIDPDYVHDDDHNIELDGDEGSDWAFDGGETSDEEYKPAKATKLTPKITKPRKVKATRSTKPKSKRLKTEDAAYHAEDAQEDLRQDLFPEESNSDVESNKKEPKPPKLVTCVRVLKTDTTPPAGDGPQKPESVICYFEDCSKAFPTQKSYERHFNAKHRSQGEDIRPYKCKTCGKEFKKHSGLTRHGDVHLVEEHRKTHTACSFCGAWKPNGPEIEAHESQHRSREQPFSCLVCDDPEAKYRNVGPLTRHMRENHPEHCGEIVNLYKCLECDKIFLYTLKLNDHLREVHGDESRRHICEVCGKIFGARFQLQTHQRKVHNDKSNRTRVICDICGRSCVDIHYLKWHKQTHQNELKFKCNFCDKAFKLLKSLRKHEVQHSGLEFKCPDCPKVFKTQPYLHQHSRVHLPREQRKYYYKTNTKEKELTMPNNECSEQIL